LFVQAEQCASLSNVSRLPNEQLALSAGKCKAVSMDVGYESVSDAQSCTHGVQLMKLKSAEREVSHDAALSVNTHAVNSQRADSGRAVEELNATMSHAIDTTSYPFTSQSDDEQLNASIMIDPSNPFDEDMIKRFLSKLAEPLSSYKNYHYMNVVMPRICVRGSLQLG